MNDLIIFGTGITAQVAYSFFKKEYNIVAFTVDPDMKTEKELFGIRILPFDEIQNHYPPDQYPMFVALGYLNMNKFREDRYKTAKQKGYRFINYIHPSVEWHDNLQIGDNNFIMDQVSVQPFVRIGNNNFIWSNATIAHHSSIQDNCWITSGVTVTGDITIKSNVFIGVNASVCNKITLENETFIGASTMISKNTSEKEVYISRDGEKMKLDSNRFLRFANV